MARPEDNSADLARLADLAEHRALERETTRLMKIQHGMPAKRRQLQADIHKMLIIERRSGGARA
ncbi:MAG: hypothetical protein KA105_02635 [Caulobacter sp.]|nr:hypothetical protein [Caulobacter sp.]